MAVVQGVRERVHLPIYDALVVEGGEQLRDRVNNGVLRFFMDVQNKTKLQTNLQSASLLPHYNTFEARALRVVISDLPPEFEREQEDGTAAGLDDVWVSDPDDKLFKADGTEAAAEGEQVTASLSGFSRIALIDLLRDARDADDGYAELDLDDDRVDIFDPVANANVADLTPLFNAGASVWLEEDDIRDMLDEINPRLIPLNEQLDNGKGHGSLLGKFIYNTVTSLYVGEKVMIQMPTWFFPAGAGPYSERGPHITHGEPSPMATFRFAEPIFIDKQQNFRVEIEVPDKDTLDYLQRIYGPLFIWVVLDGYMTRDVQ